MSQKGKIIVIEGVDGVGKETQSKKLFDYLRKNHEKVKMLSYPNYEAPSSILIKKYLNGDYGANAETINPYVTTSFFAVDRFSSYLEDWKKYYEEGYILIIDRYVTSNLLFQSTKMDSEREMKMFLDWNIDLEYDKGGLPKPDCVIYLDLANEISQRNLEKRNKSVNHKSKSEVDIHEESKEYLDKVRNNGRKLCKYLGWIVVDCTHIQNNDLRTVNDIHDEILRKTKKYI